MSKYYVTAVRYATNGSHITHVLAHLPNGSGRLYRGNILSKDDVISNMAKGHVYQTAVYRYTDGNWHNGAEIGKIVVNHVSYLRTDADKTASDNLGHLPLIDELR